MIWDAQCRRRDVSFHLQLTVTGVQTRQKACREVHQSDGLQGNEDKHNQKEVNGFSVSCGCFLLYHLERPVSAQMGEAFRFS